MAVELIKKSQQFIQEVSLDEALFLYFTCNWVISISGKSFVMIQLIFLQKKQ